MGRYDDVMLRSLLISLALTASTVAQSPSPAPTDDRVKALEAENRRLQEEVQALKQRLQQLEKSNAPSTTPTATEDPGTDPWGNPTAIRRMLGEALRSELEQQSIPIPDETANAQAWNRYRNAVTSWWQRVREIRDRFRQSVTWTLAVQEAFMTSNTQVREYEILAYVLNDSGARVGREFSIRCPASAVPNFDPNKASGVWILKAEVTPELRVAQETNAANAPFRRADTVAPQVECSIRFSVRSLELRPPEGQKPGGGSRPAR